MSFEIARKVFQSVISRDLRRFQDTGRVYFRHDGCRQRGITAAQHLYLRLLVSRNPVQTCRQINDTFRTVSGTQFPKER